MKPSIELRRAFRLVLLGFGAGAMLLSGCGQHSAPVSGILAKVGSTEIRVADLKREAELRRRNHRTVVDKQGLLDELVLQEALLQRARSVGLEADPQVQREIRNLIIGKLLDREMTSRQEAVSVTSEETKADYERNLAKYTRPAKVRLSLLFLEADQKMSEAKRAELKSRLEEARVKAHSSPAAQGFGALAMAYSDDQASRYRGGDIGWLAVGSASSRWPRRVIEAGCALEKGQMSELIDAEGGFYVVMKTDGRGPVVTPFIQVEATLRQSLLVLKRQQIEQTYRTEAVQRAGVHIDQKALAAVELPAPAAVVAQNRESGPPAIPGVNTLSRGP